MSCLTSRLLEQSIPLAVETSWDASNWTADVCWPKVGGKSLLCWLPSDMDFTFPKLFSLRCVGFLWKSWTLILLVFKGFTGCFCSFWASIREEVSCLSSYWRHLELLWCTSMQTVSGFSPMNCVTNRNISNVPTLYLVSHCLWIDAGCERMKFDIFVAAK